MTITEFLFARIAEDEAVARAALEDQRSIPAGATIFHVSALEHIARHNPARVLAECAAKRAIVENAESWNNQDLDTITRGVSRDRLGEVLRFLAPAYADHPDYQQEWAL